MNFGTKIFYKLYGKVIGKYFWPNTNNNGLDEAFSYSDNIIHNAIFGNEKILVELSKNSKNPYLISRLGSTELSTVINYLEIKYRKKKTWDVHVKKNIEELSGFFPVTDFNLKKFSELYLESIRKINILGVWYRPFEDYIVKNFCPEAFLTGLKALEPYYYDNPWSKMLKGKVVLVIHPFSTSITQQYKNRTNIFQNQEILPEFELKTFKAVQSIASQKTKFKDWFSALEWMKTEIIKIDFDIALIGAGAYGLPLASYIKQLGKFCIHIGGATQVLFGIKGKRWDDYEPVSKFYNGYWIRPNINEVPEQAKIVENGCYW